MGCSSEPGGKEAGMREYSEKRKWECLTVKGQERVWCNLEAKETIRLECVGNKGQNDSRRVCGHGGFGW